MKEGVITFIFFLIILLVSCVEKEDQRPATRRIVNETSFNVRVEVFGDESDKFIYIIEEQDSVNIEGFCNSNVVEYCLIGWRGDLAFGNIFFDEERVLSFELPSDSSSDKAINGDPLGGNGYERSDEGNVRVYTYRITQEDYEDAEPI